MKIQKWLIPIALSSTLSLESCKQRYQIEETPITINSTSKPETIQKTQGFGSRLETLLKKGYPYDDVKLTLKNNSELVISSEQLLQECIKKSRKLYPQEKIISEVKIGRKNARCEFWTSGDFNVNKGTYSIELPENSSIKTVSEKLPFDTTVVYNQITSSDENKAKFILRVETANPSIGK
jgi:alpha-galactosidase